MNVTALGLALAAILVEPYRGIPAEATLVVVAPDARALVQSTLDFPGLTRFLPHPAVREALDLPNVKRLGTLVGYYETAMGRPWPEILDAVAGRGVTLAARAGEDDGPALLTMTGTDPDATRQFVELALTAALAEQAKEAEPGTKPPQLVRTTDGQRTRVQLGDKLHLAIDGATVRVSNRAAALDRSLATLAGEHPAVDATRLLKARKSLSPGVKLWGWVDLAALKDTPEAKNYFENARKEIVGTLVVGSTVDAVRRAGDLALGYHADAGRLSLDVRVLAGRAGLAPELAVHAPPLGEPRMRPLLLPPTAVYSQAFYLDIARLWTDRDRLLNPQARKDFVAFNDQVSKVLPGPAFGEMLSMVGPNQQFVVYPPPDRPLYASTPQPPQPGAVLVILMANPELAESLDAALRAGVAVLGIATGTTLADETHGDRKLAVVRFPEGRDFPDDPQGLRFHAMPAFAAHKDAFLIASRPDLIPVTIAALDAQPAGRVEPVWHGQLSPQGLARWVEHHPDALVADALQKRGLSLESARREVAALAEMLAQSGSLTLTAVNGADALSWTLTWHAAPQPEETR